MDEILIANFMVFHDVVREDRYDLWIGDEAWELDYYLHENPARSAPHYAWLTDFVGWLPMQDGGPHEAHLTADYNAEMVEHIAAHPEVRDRALFVGNPDDIVAERLGPDLPMIRDWTERTLRFRRLRARVRSAPSSATASACAPSSATARTSRSASSPWAARGWASTCCGG